MFNTVVTFGVSENTLGLFEITLGLSGISAALSQIRCKDKTIYFGTLVTFRCSPLPSTNFRYFPLTSAFLS